jgi:hypothetical protein
MNEEQQAIDSAQQLLNFYRKDLMRLLTDLFAVAPFYDREIMATFGFLVGTIIGDTRSNRDEIALDCKAMATLMTVQATQVLEHKKAMAEKETAQCH